MIILVVAGGLSRRFGRDKRLFCVRGVPLLSRTVEVACALELPIYLALARGGSHVPWPETAAVWLDRKPGRGPLPVVLDALERRDEDVLCLAADLVSLRVSTLDELAARAAVTSADVVTYGDATRLEPLCAVYKRSCQPWLAAAWAAGETSLQRALNAQPDRVERLPMDPASGWLNLNEPRDRGNIGAPQV